MFVFALAGGCLKSCGVAESKSPNPLDELNPLWRSSCTEGKAVEVKGSIAAGLESKKVPSFSSFDGVRGCPSDEGPVEPRPVASRRDTEGCPVSSVEPKLRLLKSEDKPAKERIDEEFSGGALRKLEDAGWREDWSGIDARGFEA